MLATTTFVPSIPKILVSWNLERSLCYALLTCFLGIKEVVTLTSDLSRKNLEKDFERMDTPQGTFYRVYFDIYLTLDGSEFSAELVCQGEVMGRCRARFR
jgi:hypothetical protein